MIFLAQRKTEGHLHFWVLLDCLSAQICDGIVVASVASVTRGLRKAFSALLALCRQLEIGALHAAAGEGRRED